MNDQHIHVWRYGDLRVGGNTAVWTQYCNSCDATREQTYVLAL
jgi:hypothetical protein